VKTENSEKDWLRRCQWETECGNELGQCLIRPVPVAARSKA